MHGMIISSDYLRETQNHSRSRWRTKVFFIAVGVLVTGFYFTHQLRDWIVLPRLSVDQPTDGITLQGPKVVVEGTTTPGIRLTVNGITAYNEENGHFRAELLLPAGLHTIEVVAENRFQRVRSVFRQIVVEESKISETTMYNKQTATSTEGEM